MSLLSKFTVGPLLYLSGGLFAVCLALGGWVAILKANARAHGAEVSAITVSRDAWKDEAEEAGASSKAWKEAAGAIGERLTACHDENTRIESANGKAKREAEEAARKARARALSAQQRYADAMKDPACGVCVDAAICPALLAP